MREYQHGNALKPFDVFGLGEEAWREGEGDEIEERIREEGPGVVGSPAVRRSFIIT